ncbi:MAG: SpoIIE family protein phosphatase [Pyrinomonadaceae bacterium]|nr:SpoIIE family protein phosphatase [Pyrinomonadaceae bacterium]
MEPKKNIQESASDLGSSDLLLLKENALNVAAEGITIADMRLPEQPLIYINEGFERLTGYSAKSMIGKNCRFLQGNDTDPETVQKIRDALATGNECTVEILNYDRDSRPFWNRLSLTPVINDAGEVTHFIGVQSDITEIKNTEEALRKANNQLEIANRRMTRNLEAAARIQRSLLPERERQFDGILFASLVQPCDELGGDALNWVPLGENRFAVYTVDVSGHGVRASLLSVTLSHWFSRILELPASSNFSSSPVEVAEVLNSQFQMSSENVQYFTMCFGVVDLDQGEFRFVTAGSPPIAVLRSTGETEILNIEGFPIGLVEEATYSESMITVSKGDRVFVYTDGVIEAENEDGEGFGTERLADKLLGTKSLTLANSLDSILDAVSSWEFGVGHRDDCSLLAFEIE